MRHLLLVPALLFAGLCGGNAGSQPLQPLPGQNAMPPPVGSTTSPGTTTQIFPHPPVLTPAQGVTGSPSPPVGGRTPIPATATPMSGYAAPGTVPMPGYAAPPGTIGFPPVTSVPAPGASVIPGADSMTGSSGTTGTGATGSVFSY